MTITKIPLYIIPGYNETKLKYKWLIDAARKKYDVIFLDLRIYDKSFRDLLRTSIKPGAIVFGFSIGALIAYKLEAKIKRGIYCSMTDTLGADTKGRIKYMREMFGNVATEEMKAMDYGLPNAEEYVMFCGDREISRNTHKMKNMTIVPNTGHSFSRKYRELVLKELGLA